MPPLEMREVDRQARIDRMTPAMHIRPFGNTSRNSQIRWKFPGALSTTRAASGPMRRSTVRYASAASAIAVASMSRREIVQRSTVSFQNDSSPPPATVGWEDKTCSTSVVPDRGMPSTSTGNSSSRCVGRATNSAVRRNPSAEKPAIRLSKWRSTCRRSSRTDLALSWLPFA